MSTTFQKSIEDFRCGHCGADISGNGYTNHCPACLWSKHVDNDPGDRANECGGAMKPHATELEHGEQVIVHKCEKCGEEKRNKAQEGDDFDKVLDVMIERHGHELKIP